MTATTEDRLTAGLALEQAGRLEQAAAEYQAALGEAPDDPAALHRLGLTVGKLGHRDLALRLMGQAIARSPAVARYHHDLGEALLAAGFPADAVLAFEEVLRLAPDSAEAVAGIADGLIDLGRVDEARRLVRAAAAEPPAPRMLRPLGRLALAAGEPAAAVEHFVGYLRSNFADPVALFYLGVALQGLGFLEPAAASYRQAVDLDGSLFEAWSNLSTVLLALGDPAAALAAADRALALAPDRPGAWLNRANARRDAGLIADAGDDYRHAVELDPSYAEGWSSLGNLYHDLAEWSLALDAHARAVELAPSIPQVHWNRSFTLLATGDLALGFEEYESRLLTDAARPEPRAFPWPTWHGEPLAGKRVLVWREQGLGDELLFAAALPELVRTGARITFLVSPRLASLFRRSFPEVEILPDLAGALDARVAFDYQSPLASLPRWLRLGRADFDRFGPFLRPDPGQRDRWIARLAGLGSGPKVGICWRSGLVTADRRRHYAPLQEWKPIFRAAGITLINLQYDDCAVELEAIERDWGVRVHRWSGEDLKDDLESAVGLLSALDGAVSAPTAVSSLAGGVGTPTWQVDSGSDWTVFGESRSPWLPSVRVVARRPDDQDWGPVVRAVAADLEALGRSGRVQAF